MTLSTVKKRFAELPCVKLSPQQNKTCREVAVELELMPNNLLTLGTVFLAFNTLCCAVAVPVRFLVLVIPVYVDAASIATRAIHKKLRTARNSALLVSKVSQAADWELMTNLGLII